MKLELLALELILISFTILSSVHGQRQEEKSQCGFPGTPAFGFVKPDEDLYDAGDVVTYSCRVGYILLGAPIRRCKEDGSWTEEVPICDDSMTTLGFASSTPAAPGHPAELAIDRDKDTCTHLTPKKTRWWRIDLGEDHKVLSVAVTMADTDKFTKFTVFVIKIQDTIASYRRCASFSGKFGTPTIVLTCAEGKGIEGQRVHIEDHLQTDGVFEVCEVEVQVEKETGYECGRPDRNPNSITFDVEGDQVEYGCLTGYELEGREFRQCLSSGHWSGEPPTCEAIICEPLPFLENGKMQLSVINDGDIPLEGTVANFNCDEGYRLLGDFNRICLKDGSWSGKQPHCEAVRCPVPDGSELGGIYRLVNRTTRMGSMAKLKCKKGKMDGSDPYIICTEEGDWTKPQSRCTIHARIVANTDSPKIAKKEAIIFGMVVAGIMMTIVLVSLYIITQRRRRARKPALPLRQIEAPEAPPRPPPRTKGVLASTLLECVSGSSEQLSEYGGNEKETETLLKTRSLPGRNKGNREADMPPNRAASLEQKLSETPDHEPEGKASPNKDQAGADDAVEAENDSTTAATPTSEEAVDQEKESKPTEIKAAAKDYAAVDYEKKRQSRLQKEQSGEESSPKPEESPTEEENDAATPPKVPPKEIGSTSDQKPESRTESPSESSEPADTKQPESAESSGPAQRTRGKVAEEQTDSDKALARRTRRTRAQAEPPAEPEEKATTRGLRRTRVRE